MRTTLAAFVLLALFGGPCLGGAKPKGPKPGEKLIDVELQTLDGKKAMLSDLTRGRVAVIEFGATWCPWCTRETRDLNEIVQSFPLDKVVVLRIDLAEEAKRVEADNAAHGVMFLTLLDPQEQAADRYGVDTIPDILIVGHDGTILHHRADYTTAAQIRRILAPALKAMDEAPRAKPPAKK